MIIPAINVRSFDEARRRVRLAEEILGDDGWIHIDISDGVFTPLASWGDPDELKKIDTSLSVEVHLMTAEPEKLYGEWLVAGVERIIIHIQKIRDVRALADNIKKNGAELMVSVDPSVGAESVLPYSDYVNAFQILAVPPGLSGQKFSDDATRKIEKIRSASPTVVIEIDGGINPETARIAKGAGANLFISGSYIFDDINPRGAYERLTTATRG